MKQLHKPSGYVIKTNVSYYDDIKKFNAGVVIINPSGMKTNRIAPDPTMYNTEKEAEESSLHHGKKLLSNHLSSEETLYFDR